MVELLAGSTKKAEELTNMKGKGITNETSIYSAAALAKLLGQLLCMRTGTLSNCSGVYLVGLYTKRS